MTDDEYRINEECGDGSGRSGNVSMKVVRLDDILSAMGIHKPDVDESERPSMKMKHIATVNFMFGKLRVAQEILNDMGTYDPHMDEYLDRDAREEFDDALCRAERAVNNAMDLLFKEVKEQNKLLDVWKEKEGSDDEGA